MQSEMPFFTPISSLSVYVCVCFCLAEFSISLSKVDTFLQTLSKESLSLVAEKQRKVCIKHVQEMMSAIQNTRRNGNNNLLAVGLSHSTQELYNATAAVAHISNDLKRSDSLPEVSNGSIQVSSQYSAFM